MIGSIEQILTQRVTLAKQEAIEIVRDILYVEDGIEPDENTEEVNYVEFDCGKFERLLKKKLTSGGGKAK